ncbi:DUF1214 domain-containing protein, partial [Phaeovulum sp.]|uniref:DUF1214 domain-containing protein n=1 Tax=Phaeovulum sp. TaxID=2934796 RepID=UPI0039E35480
PQRDHPAAPVVYFCTAAYADGGITLYFQNESPGKDKEANWLPAPKGPFWVILRLYWPKEAALNGTWKAPAVERVTN